MGNEASQQCPALNQDGFPDGDPAREASIAESILPKRLEPFWRQLRVAHGVLNIFVPEVMLQGARVLSVVGELVPAGVPQHVRVYRKWKLDCLPYPRKHLPKASTRHRRTTLCDKDISRFNLLAPQSPQPTYLAAAHRLHTRCPILETPHVQKPALQIDLIPPERTQLRTPQPMPVRHQDHRRIAVPVTPAQARTLDEFRHFLDGQVFAWPALRIRKPARRYCPIYGVRPSLALTAFHGRRSSVHKVYCPVNSPFRDS
jgi:hypothetical protein